MPINPNIALSVQPMQLQNPMNALAQYAQIQQGQQANELGKLQMDEYKRARAEEEQVRNYLAQGGDLNSPEVQRQLMGMGKSGMGLVSTLQAQKKNQSEQSKTESEALISRAKLSRELLSQVQTPEDYLMWHVGNHKDPVLGPYLASRGITAESSMENIQRQLAQPGGFQKLLQQSALGADKFIERTTMSLKDMADLRERQASRAQSERHFQAGQNAPVFSADAGGWVTRPGAGGNSAVIPVEGMQPKLPAAVEKELVGINQQKSIVQGAIDAVTKTPGAFSLGRGLAGSLPMGETLAGRSETPEQTQARAYVFNNVSKVINERAGAAQSAQELQRLKSFLPADTDNAKQITNKLKAFQTYLADLEKGTTSKRSPTKEQPKTDASIESLLEKYK